MKKKICAKMAKKIFNLWTAGLILLFFAYLFINILVLNKDSIYPLYDSWGIVERAYIWAHMMSEGSFQFPQNFQLFTIGQPGVSPLLSLLLTLNILIFGGNIDVIMYTNMLFLAILIYSLYNLGKIMSDRLTGFISVVVCLSFPAVFGMSRTMWCEFPLMCVMTLSYYFLFKTDYFQNKKYSFLWVITMACGLFIKFTLPLYIFFPVFIYIVKSFLERKDRKQLIAMLLKCALLLFLVAGLWYMLSFYIILESRLQMFSGMHADLLINIQRLYSCLCNLCIYPIFFFLFIASLVFMLFKPRFESYIIILGVLIPMIILVIVPEGSGFNSNRYFIPILPLIALCIGNLIALSNNKTVKHIIFFILIILSCTQFLLVNLGLGGILLFSKSRFEHIFEPILEQGKTVPFVSKMDTNKILYLLKHKKTQKIASILFLGDFPNLESFLRLTSLKALEPIYVESPIPNIKGFEPQDIYDNPKMLDHAEFILTLDDGWQDNEDSDFHFLLLIPKTMAAFNNRRNYYKRIGTFKDNLGLKIVLFQKIQDINSSRTTS